MAKHEVHHHGAQHVEHHHHRDGGEEHDAEEHGGGPASRVDTRETEQLETEYAAGGRTGYARGGRHPTHAGHRHASHGHEMMNEGPHPGHPKDSMKRGGRSGHHVEAEGVHSVAEAGEPADARHEQVQEYNAQGSNEMAEMGDEKPGFKRGGKKHEKRRHGGHAEGHMERERLDRRPRRAAGGKAGVHNPYSSASKMMDPETDMPGRGYEGKMHKP